MFTSNLMEIILPPLHDIRFSVSIILSAAENVLSLTNSDNDEFSVKSCIMTLHFHFSDLQQVCLTPFV